VGKGDRVLARSDFQARRERGADSLGRAHEEHDAEEGGEDRELKPGGRDEACPISTGGGTRRVQLVRGEGRGVSN